VVAEELRGMSASEIEIHVVDLREQLFKLRFQKTTGHVESASRLSVVRRDIARSLTIARERQMSADKVATAGSEEQA
jgi:large subunit ribosomal protein L29